MTAPRPKQHLLDAGRRHPGAWRLIDTLREDRSGLPPWPDWCYLPIAGALAIVALDAGTPVELLALTAPERIPDGARLCALATWRMTQGIYRFDPALYPALIATPLSGDIPCDVLYRLPEWCVYIETPGLSAEGQPLHGFFAHLEHDVASGRAELRLLLDQAHALTPLPLHLGRWPLAEALARAVGEGRQQAARTLSTAGHADRLAAHDPAPLLAELAPLLSLLLYLCAEQSDIGDGTARPGNPQPKKTKRGWRLFAAEKARSWDVGVRIGAALRRAYQAAESSGGGDGSHASPRPHVRRAHWHGFRSGPLKTADGAASSCAGCHRSRSAWSWATTCPPSSTRCATDPRRGIFRPNQPPPGNF